MKSQEPFLAYKRQLHGQFPHWGPDRLDYEAARRWCRMSSAKQSHFAPTVRTGDTSHEGCSPQSCRCVPDPATGQAYRCQAGAGDFGANMMYEEPFFAFVRQMQRRYADRSPGRVADAAAKVWCEMSQVQKNRFAGRAKKNTSYDLRKPQPRRNVAGRVGPRHAGVPPSDRKLRSRQPFFNFLMLMKKVYSDCSPQQVADEAARRWCQMVPEQRSLFEGLEVKTAQHVSQPRRKPAKTATNRARQSHTGKAVSGKNMSRKEPFYNFVMQLQWHCPNWRPERVAVEAAKRWGQMSSVQRSHFGPSVRVNNTWYQRWLPKPRKKSAGATARRIHCCDGGMSFVQQASFFKFGMHVQQSHPDWGPKRVFNEAEKLWFTMTSHERGLYESRVDKNIGKRARLIPQPRLENVDNTAANYKYGSCSRPSRSRQLRSQACAQQSCAQPNRSGSPESRCSTPSERSTSRNSCSQSSTVRTQSSTSRMRSSCSSLSSGEWTSSP